MKMFNTIMQARGAVLAATDLAPCDSSCWGITWSSVFPSQPRQEFCCEETLARWDLSKDLFLSLSLFRTSSPQTPGWAADLAAEFWVVFFFATEHFIPHTEISQRKEHLLFYLSFCSGDLQEENQLLVLLEQSKLLKAIWQIPLSPRQSWDNWGARVVLPH